jgi:GTPase SAR1 family protein
MTCCAGEWNPKLQVLLLGAFSSGKTTILREIMNDTNYKKRPLIPTLGMYMKNVSFQNYKVSCCFYKVKMRTAWGVQWGRRRPQAACPAGRRRVGQGGP